MAGYLKLLPFLFGLAAGVAGAEALSDPTRPPPGFAGETGDAPVADSGPLLQSVMVPRQGRPAAVISGKTVRQGETWGDSRLVEVTENSVLLVGPQGRQRLLLLPDVQKEMVKDESTAKPAKGRKRKVP